MNNQSVASNNDKKNGINTQALKDINDGWGLLQELEENRFVIAARKENKDIEKTSRILQRISAEEDALRESDISKDEMNAGRGIRSVTSPAISAVQNALDAFDEDLEDESATTSVHIEKKSFLKPETPKIVVQPQINTVKEESKSKTSTVEKESLVSKEISKSNNESDNQLKLFALGLSKSYQSKTNNLLGPLKFLMEKNNLKAVLMALAHMIVPLLMTWYVTQKLPFIAAQLNKESIVMMTVYVFIFYFASLFIWFLTQVTALGLINVGKKMFYEIVQNGRQDLK